MHRAQIIIEKWQYEALKALAQRRGTSISHVVREILEERLGKSGRRLSAIRGIGRDEAAGRDHDALIYEE